MPPRLSKTRKKKYAQRKLSKCYISWPEKHMRETFGYLSAEKKKNRLQTKFSPNVVGSLTLSLQQHSLRKVDCFENFFWKIYIDFANILLLHLCVFMNTYLYIYVKMHMYIWLCVSVCTCVYIKVLVVIHGVFKYLFLIYMGLYFWLT